MDRTARLKHLLDQLGANIEDIAPLLGQYYRALERESHPFEVAARLLAEVRRVLLDRCRITCPGSQRVLYPEVGRLRIDKYVRFLIMRSGNTTLKGGR